MENKLIYGCMGLGGSWNRDPLTSEDQKKADRVIETALEAGISHFDHADIYTLGKAEEVFGNFLKRNDYRRESLFIQSKTGIQLNAGPMGSSTYNLSETYVLNQVNGILKRLKTDYLDALLLHRPDPLTPMSQLAETLTNLKNSGKVHAFGVSNMSTDQIQSLQSFLPEPLIANQIRLGLEHSYLLDLEVWVNRMESPKEVGLRGLLAYSQHEKLCIQAYSPLAKGKFANLADLSETDKKTALLLLALAEQYKTTTTGVLLSWLWKIPADIQPIIGTTNVQRIKESADARKLNLSREDWYNLWITAKGINLP